jgi:hypothetical protein
MAKHRLDTVLNFSYPLWGIVSSASPHKLCYALNKRFHFDLKWQQEIILENQKTIYNHINLFTYEDELDYFTIEVIQNKNGDCLFIPELKNIDYFLIIKGSADRVNLKIFTQHLNNINCIQTVVDLQLQKIKSRNNFLVYN